jgi:hypothetical protein
MARIEQILQGSVPQQAELFALVDDVDQILEAAAERYSALIIAKLAQPVAAATPEQDYHTVDINHIEVAQARSIGVETLALHAFMQLQLAQMLAALGFNKIDSAAALSSIIGRMVSPGSELKTHDWLQASTGLDELLDQRLEAAPAWRACIRSAISCSNSSWRWKRFWPLRSKAYSI